MRDILEARKRGDLAFRDKEFRTAIDCYSEVLVHTRGCLLNKNYSFKCFLTRFQSCVDQCLPSSYPLQFVNVGVMVSPTVFARRSLCYLMCDQPDAALRDAMQAQCIYPDWSTAFYLQAVALAKLDMNKDSIDMLNEAAALEEKRQRSTKSS